MHTAKINFDLDHSRGAFGTLY